ncbi:MAG: type II toxin-antitoxin system RelE/ParE family toxin [Vicinamibacterales bacterium]|jgi:mRNA interferase RelE/StbE|nr:type II toxin-antitoxin system RelE/ParE family toxin [Vicinamibacterales bacterium]
MTRYSVQITRTAERALKKLPQNDRHRVARTVAMLAIDPRPRGARKLSGHDDVFRVRTGRYRLLYSIEDKRLIVLVLKIGHRKDVYR